MSTSEIKRETKMVTPAVGSEPAETQTPREKVYCTRYAIMWAESVRMLLGVS